MSDLPILAATATEGRGGSDLVASRRAELATVNHILYDQGVLDGFGNVGLRHPERPDRFLLSRNLAPALVEAADILEFDLDANLADGGSERVYLERFIHGEIYRMRPDVGAVVHSHAASVLPFTVASGINLCPVCHMAGFIKTRTPVFEIRAHAGEGGDLLIRNRELGVELARCLGGHAVVLMRGHGMTVVGADVRQAVFRAVYAQAIARMQATALSLGTVTGLTEAEADAADSANNSQIDRAWQFWALSARQRIGALRAMEA